jgi:hypothetical protein
MALPWAKFPVQWLKPSAAAVDGEKKYPMTDLEWSRYAGTSIGMVLVLIALSIRLNQSQKDMVFEKGQARGTCVAVTYKDLRHMTGLAKATISQALMLLEGFGALSVERAGRASSYRLIGLDVAGGWCQLPQSWLLNRDGTLKLKKLPRNRLALNALKAYLLLMALRDRQLNTAAVSYGGADKNLDWFYAASPRLTLYSIGLRAPREILIRFSLYQRMYEPTTSMNCSMVVPIQSRG